MIAAQCALADCQGPLQMPLSLPVLRPVDGCVGQARQHLRHIWMLRTQGLLADCESSAQHRLRLVELALKSEQVG
jgi:hypothetical protein